ncbi:MAG: peroxide stress protein YaaA [Saprospiraceae bacterium]|nr:peroxide stress protein YaaA [Saprospiraceae bacterium]
MIILLSPAKSLDFNPKPDLTRTQPRLKKDTLELAEIMRKKTAKDLKKLMSISDKLADLNADRFHNFEDSHNKTNSKQAMFAFTGDVYVGLDAETFSAKDIEFAQKHVRMLSGLYGLLRPLDVIQPYRLEMGTKLKTERGNNLYEFWGNRIAEKIQEDLKTSGNKAIINLASQEYFKAVQPEEIDCDLYIMHFLELRDKEYKFISFNAKKARGYMTKYIVKNKITNPEKIKGFNLEGYMYNPDLSKDREWVFTR